MRVSLSPLEKIDILIKKSILRHDVSYFADIVVYERTKNALIVYFQRKNNSKSWFMRVAKCFCVTRDRPKRLAA